VIGEADWRALADAASTAVDPVAFAADVTPERSHAAIAVAGRRADGLGHGEVATTGPAPGGVVPRLVELASRWRPCSVVVDDTGPAGNLIAPLEAAGVEVTRPTARGMAHTAGDLFDAVAEATMRVVPRPALDAAVAGAAQRPLGDGWAWARKGLSVDICPLVALSLARWAGRPGPTCTRPGRESTCSTETAAPTKAARRRLAGDRGRASTSDGSYPPRNVNGPGVLPAGAVRLAPAMPRMAPVRGLAGLQ
jgi:hypothetical protein